MASAKHTRDLKDIALDRHACTCQNKFPAEENPHKLYKYKDDHARLYDENRLSWPPRRIFHKETLGHLDQRLYEVAVFADIVFPLHAESGPQYLDVNESLTRACGPRGDRNPWRSTLHTLTTTGIYLVRQWVFGKNELRQLDGLELLQAIGYDRRYLVEDMPVPTHKLASHMAGNAFSGYSIGAALVACLLNFTTGETTPSEDAGPDAK